MSKPILAALAGQPNSGKSTLFNMLTGARQHVANYPGVTVEKKAGVFVHEGRKVDLIDLPGTYSLTSYSLEERVARDFILNEHPSVVTNVLDASNLRRGLAFSLQLLELGVPLVLVANMMDIVNKRGAKLDLPKLSQQLGVPVVGSNAQKGEGVAETASAIVSASENPQVPSMRVDYGPMTPHLDTLEQALQGIETDVPHRWLAIKLMENDAGVRELISKYIPAPDDILSTAAREREAFEAAYDLDPEVHTAHCRNETADALAQECTHSTDDKGDTFSDRIDAIVCHRILGPLVMLGVILLLYYLAIDVGYKLTEPLIGWLLAAKASILSLLPNAGMIEDPMIRSLGIWFMDSMIALLTYIPIFLILFGLIAILEDSGYMPRMAFMLDRLFRNFGLHGQSTLPLILGGIYMGGCAVPGVMATKGIPDERARIATILIVPMMNCLAKVPLYVLLISAFFSQTKTLAMFFISTVTIFMALPVAKILSLTLLKDKETAPFLMEMPTYHIPTLRTVAGRAVERTWLFLKKIVTIVAAVSVIIFALLQYPGITQENIGKYQEQWDRAVTTFEKKIGSGNIYAPALSKDGLGRFILYSENYKQARMGVTDQEAANKIFEEYQQQNPTFAALLKPAKADKDAKKVKQAMRGVIKTRKKIRLTMHKERLNSSFLGRLGESLTPITKYAGFDAKVNISLLAAFAAKESTVSTLGALYTSDVANQSLDSRIQDSSTGFTPLHALALMLFMALYPPCIATSIMVKIQSGSWKWMAFSICYQMFLGLGVATLVYSGGVFFGLNGLQAMGAFYALAVAVTLATGLYNPSPSPQPLPNKEMHA
ncbi:MAG: ferrous iron transport protein B [Desulfovibrio sp.]|uniref:ferrous iron transport protein B n=1 Tax=Desulfovibrio sp. 7SRBS1 TaxID=3378064 RepID=UPI003B424BBF